MTGLQVEHTHDALAAAEFSGVPGGPSFWQRVRKSPLHDCPVRDEILRQYLAIEADSSVLELGPGSGFTAFCMSRTVRSLTLVDIAQQTIADLQEQLSDQPNVRCVHADTTRPGFAESLNEKFDVAFGLDVFEYVPEPVACLRNLTASLREGGRLFLTFPNFAPPAGDGVTYFSELSELEAALRAAGLSDWRIFTVKLNPYAQRIYQVFHEWPLSIYRKLRGGQNGQPQVYEATWAFQNRGKLRRYRAVMHFYWEIIIGLLRLGGAPFTARPVTDGILNRQLVLIGRR